LSNKFELRQLAKSSECGQLAKQGKTRYNGGQIGEGARRWNLVSIVLMTSIGNYQYEHILVHAIEKSKNSM
jgi:hypothetical protein